MIMRYFSILSLLIISALLTCLPLSATPPAPSVYNSHTTYNDLFQIGDLYYQYFSKDVSPLAEDSFYLFPWEYNDYRRSYIGSLLSFSHLLYSEQEQLSLSSFFSTVLLEWEKDHYYEEGKPTRLLLPLYIDMVNYNDSCYFVIIFSWSYISYTSSSQHFFPWLFFLVNPSDGEIAHCKDTLISDDTLPIYSEP